MFVAVGPLNLVAAGLYPRGTVCQGAQTAGPRSSGYPPSSSASHRTVVSSRWVGVAAVAVPERARVTAVAARAPRARAVSRMVDSLGWVCRGASPEVPEPGLNATEPIFRFA
ncbi:MAG TPA: hypothetical protein VH008_19925 [Pseudonocardia sp.]|nr:hypothetical protein [Pseudonocardia sp.]